MSVSGLQGAGRDFYFPEYDFDPNTAGVERKANGLPADGFTRGTDRQHAGMITGRAWFKALTLQWFLTSRIKHLPTGEYETVFDHPRTHFGDTRGMVEAMRLSKRRSERR